MLSTAAKRFIKAVLRNIITNLCALKECDTAQGPSSLQRGQSQVLCVLLSVLYSRHSTEHLIPNEKTV